MTSARAPVPDPNGCPAALGFHMPAEWEAHAATWLAWPHKQESWPGNFEPIPRVWMEIVRALAPHERVNILVNDAGSAAEVRRVLDVEHAFAPSIALLIVPTDDAWVRDSGPTFLARTIDDGRRELAAVHWRYNAWGGKYPPWERDAAVGAAIAAHVDARIFRPGIVMEGGSFDVNGRGSLLTTEACLLNPNRNPHLTRPEIERYLRQYLGVWHVLWLAEGIVGDDTDGHVDDLARFIDPRTVVTVLETDTDDDNYEPLRANYERLQRMRDQDGEPLRVVPLPMPAPVFDGKQRLPASYANFYIANAVVLVPIFDDPRDAEALATLQRLFPRRRVIGIRARELVLGLGAFHCVTQQQPAL